MRQSSSPVTAQYTMHPKYVPVIIGLIGVWLLTMIALPIMRWTLGEASIPFSLTISVFAQVIVSLAVLSAAWRPLQIAAVVAIVALTSWAIEFIGHTTGFPFGVYAYTDVLQPQINGVPGLIPLAWLMMLPPAWAVASAITQRLSGWRGRVAFIAVSALAFTAWDLYLDPLMVGWNVWQWADPDALNYFGIPLSNYAGWLLASAVLTALASLVAPVRHLPRQPLMALYTVTWLLQAGGLIVFWGLPGPGIIGFLGMGAMLVWAWQSSRRRTVRR